MALVLFACRSLDGLGKGGSDVAELTVGSLAFPDEVDDVMGGGANIGALAVLSCAVALSS